VKFRTSHRALSVNDTDFLHVDFNDGKRVLVWRRGRAGSDRQVVVVANFSDFVTANAGSPSAEYRVPGEDLAFLADLNDALAGCEAKLDREVVPASLSIAIIGGLQRSGTTLLHQILARHCHIAYVSNVMARFWNAPLAGARLLEGTFANPRGLDCEGCRVVMV